MLKKLVFVICIVSTFAFTAHKYYLSLCEIEYVEEQQSVQIILGLFIDDLEFTLNKIHQKSLDLATEDELEGVDTYFEEYLRKNFKISIDEKPGAYNYIGKEYEDDIVRFYLELTDIQEINSIEIINTSLFSDFREQKNIIKIKVKKLYKTFYLDKNNDKGLLNL